jgi:limonene 1,2-monooxygenase
LRGGRLQLLPYTRPTMPISVACVFSPAGPTVVGKYGVGMLTISSTVFGGLGAYAESWKTAEESAERNGQSISRDDWHLVMPIHIADTTEEAIRQVRERFHEFQLGYFGAVLGRTGRPEESNIEWLIERGFAIVGSPDDAVAAITRLQEVSGGFGGLLNVGFEWASREQIMHSYELWSRHVAPHFQGSLRGQEASRDWLHENATTVFASGPAAKRKAFEDAGVPITEEILQGLGRSAPQPQRP